MKAIKKYFIRRRNAQFQKLSLARSYPNSFNKIGIISKADFKPDTNFITKLKIGFGKNIQIFIFVLEDKKKKQEDFFNLTTDDFNLLGNFKNEKIFSNLKDLDLLIDITLSRSVLKSYILNHSQKAFKISLGNEFCNNCNLAVNLNIPDQNLFADEIIKYHNILKK